MEQITNRFEGWSKIILYVIAALLPVWFIPWSIDVDFGREITFAALILLAVILWLLSALTQNELRYQHSLLIFSGVILLAVFILSTIFSNAPMVSTIFADPVGERLSTLILGILLMLLAGGVLRSRAEVGIITGILIFSGSIAGILSLLQIFGWSPYQVPMISNWLPVLQKIDFNVIGTINALSLFFTALLVMGLGLILAGRKLPFIARITIFSASTIFFVNLLVINFWASWLVLMGSSIFLLGLLFRNMYLKSATSQDGRQFSWRYWTVLAVLVFSVVMSLLRTPLISGTNLPAEVSPSLKSTLKITWEVFKEDPKAIILGSGPGTFGLSWSRFKDPSINQTIFWGLRFNQGFSWATTLLSTVGILGAFAFLLFLGLSLITFLKRLFTTAEEELALPISIFLGFAAVIISSFLYPATFSFVILLFFFTGLLTTSFGGGQISESGGKFISWEITPRAIRFENPTIVFISSLVIVFCIALSVAGLYFTVTRTRAAIAVQQGRVSLSHGGVDEAVNSFLSAVNLEDKNPRYQQMLTEARMEKIRSLIQRASRGENVQQEFLTATTLAIKNSQRAIELNSKEPILWRTQGVLYELMIPFINGSEGFAVSGYKKAAELDPVNPAIYADWGRALLVYADKAQLLIAQASEQDRVELSKTRVTVLEEAEKVFRKSIEVKSDFALAHFLLAQTALRLGNTSLAIQSVEAAKVSAPFDIGVAFQLGLLYYQQNDLGKAEAEFSRAVSINTNYSNARYFLGLIYDRRGRKEAAVGEFEKILQLNPGNREVERILTNLRGGRSALANISPPAEAPEKRKETPVK